MTTHKTPRPDDPDPALPVAIEPAPLGCAPAWPDQRASGRICVGFTRRTGPAVARASHPDHGPEDAADGAGCRSDKPVARRRTGPAGQPQDSRNRHARDWNAYG